MSLVNLSKDSLNKILECMKRDNETIRQLRRTRFGMNQLVSETGMHRFVAEEVRIQSVKHFHLADRMFEDMTQMQDILDDILVVEHDENAELDVGRIEEQLLNILAADVPRNVANAERVDRVNLYVTIKKEDLINLRHPQQEDPEIMESLAIAREEVASRDPYFFFSEAPMFYRGRAGYTTEEEDILKKTRKTPEYMIKSLGVPENESNNDKLFRMWEQAMKQIRSLEMLSIFDVKIDMDFLERLRAVDFDLKKVTKLNLQCTIDLTHPQFLELLKLFSLKSILIESVFSQECLSEECFVGINERIYILAPSVCNFSQRLLDYWKQNPPRHITIGSRVEWTFSQIWDFITDIARQKRPEHRLPTFYTFDLLVDSPAEKMVLARCMMNRGYIWKTYSTTDQHQMYEVTPKDSQVHFTFTMLMI